MTVTELEEDQGCKVMHAQIEMPMFVSNRSVVSCQYKGETADGFTYRIGSSQGNEAIIEAQADLIGDNVVANQIMSFLAFKPYDGGVELKSVAGTDLAGMIPDMVKNKMASRQANRLKNLVGFLRDGVRPEDA